MAQSYSIIKLIDLISHCESHLVSPESTIKKLLIDSRQLVNPKSTLFIALKTSRNNGHNYISELYSKGVRNFLVSEKQSSIDFPEANFLLVDNTLLALQELAKNHRKKFNIPVIGITGSNGKTIIKEWLFQLLSPDFSIVKSPKSFNSQVGVPLSIWEMDNTHQLGIFEAGISQPNEMDFLEEIIKPTIGVITNVKSAHSENFNSIQNISDEKIRLFKDVDVCIFPKDYLEISNSIKSLPAKINFTWSTKTKADLVVTKIEKLQQNSTLLKGIFKDQFLQIEIPFTDDASIENAILCWSILLYLKIENDTIALRMKNLQAVAMRLQMKSGINSCNIIHDYYNSDLGSLEIAIQYLKNQTRHLKKTLILSDVLQAKNESEILYTEISNLIKENNIDKLIGIGTNLKKFEALFDTPEKLFFLNTDEFLNQLKPEHFWNETILIKGSRNFEFEQIAKFLEEKSHETILEINLENLIQNVNYYKNLLPEKTKIMAMVKAFSYGSGTFEIASALQFHNINYLAVAYADEGIELRNKGIHLPIMVMNPSEDSFEALLRYNLEPEIYSTRIFDSFARALKKHYPFNKKFPIHIKVNTGMNRLGFDLIELENLCNKINNLKQITVQSVFSHLVASEDPEKNDFTISQIEKFEKACLIIQNEINYNFIKHLSNTSAIKNYPKANFDMVRLGIGMYGVANSEEEKKLLMPVGKLKTTINQLRKVEKNQTIGYGRSGQLYRDSIIATIPIGYADGFSRSLGNGIGKVYINGKLAPTIGNICMDMTMLDVTEINCIEGDEVIIFGPEYPIYNLAKSLNTIPYEVLTLVSQRVKRVFIKE